MRATLHMGKRLFRLVERKNLADHRLHPANRMVRVRSRGFCRRRDDFCSQRCERLVEVEFGAIETCRGETRPERQRGSPWGPYESHQRQRQAEQRRSPMAVASGGKLPGRHLHLSRHRAGIAGENVVKVVPRDGVSPPLPVWKFNRRRAYPANPCRSACRVSLYAIRRIISGEGLSSRGHDRIPEISAWPGAQIESERACTGLIPGRGGSSAGT